MENKGERSQERQNLVDQIFSEASQEVPQLAWAEEIEVKKIIFESLKLAKTFEKAAEPPHPKVHQDTDIVWILSGPGAYSLTFPPYKDKEDRYQNLPWTRNMDRRRVRTGAALVYEITAKRLGVDVRQITRDDIKKHGPWFIYNGTPKENQHILSVLSQKNVKIPPEKTFMFDSFENKDGQIQPIENTTDQVASFHFPQNTIPRRIVIVSHAPHLVRILHILGQFPDRIPHDTIVQPYPIKSPAGYEEEYQKMEIKGLLYYIYQLQVAAKTPHPYEL